VSKPNRQILDPKRCLKLVPAIASSGLPHHDMWCYRYNDPETGWIFSIASFGAPGSGNLSLGGFRIVPEARAVLPGFDPSREAIELGLGMEEKVYWSRLIRVGAKHALANFDRIVGGKCVLLPTKGARVGEPRDVELLDFALACCADFESDSGVSLTTGQDLGHGIMSDGKTSSLGYLSTRFGAFVVSDTSKPTAEGNFYTLKGCLAGLGIALKDARIGLIGVGNIGEHLLMRLLQAGSSVQAIESNPTKRNALSAQGVTVFEPHEKAAFIAQQFDALALNANGGSLDPETVSTICKNQALKVVCGCENLVMPDPLGNEKLREAQKIYTPTEMCGMMGYLTAVEEYLSRRAGEPFGIEMMFAPAVKLEEVGRKGAERAVSGGFVSSFEDAVRSEYHCAGGGIVEGRVVAC